MDSRRLHALCRTEIRGKVLCVKAIRCGRIGVGGLDSELSATRRMMSVSRRRRIWKGFSIDFDIEGISGSGGLLRPGEGIGKGGGNMWLGTRFLGEDARLVHALRHMSALDVSELGM